MAPLSNDRNEPHVSLRRSLTTHFTFSSGFVLWGATWASLCGLAAAMPWPAEWSSLSRAFVAWLVAVPLAGAVWTTMLARSRHQDSADVREAPPIDASWLDRARDALAGRGATERLQAVISTDTVAAGLAALAIAAVLGPRVFVVVATGLAIAVGGFLARASWVRPTGWARSVLEILVPALVGWLAMHGAHRIPAPVIVDEGARTAFATWVGANWPFLAVCVAFTIVHHALTAGGLPRRRHVEYLTGMMLTVAILAAANRPLGAGIVAMCFVVTWPMLGLLMQGRGRAHLVASQWFVMAAMLVACVAAGIG